MESDPGGLSDTELEEYFASATADGMFDSFKFSQEAKPLPCWCRGMELPPLEELPIFRYLKEQNAILSRNGLATDGRGCQGLGRGRPRSDAIVAGSPSGSSSDDDDDLNRVGQYWRRQRPLTFGATQSAAANGRESEAPVFCNLTSAMQSALLYYSSAVFCSNRNATVHRVTIFTFFSLPHFRLYKAIVPCGTGGKDVVADKRGATRGERTAVIFGSGDPHLVHVAVANLGARFSFVSPSMPVAFLQRCPSIRPSRSGSSDLETFPRVKLTGGYRGFATVVAVTPYVPRLTSLPLSIQHGTAARQNLPPAGPSPAGRSSGRRATRVVRRTSKPRKGSFDPKEYSVCYGLEHWARTHAPTSARSSDEAFLCEDDHDGGSSTSSSDPWASSAEGPPAECPAKVLEVGNVPRDVTSEALEGLLSLYGAVEEIAFLDGSCGDHRTAEVTMCRGVDLSRIARCLGEQVPFGASSKPLVVRIVSKGGRTTDRRTTGEPRGLVAVPVDRRDPSSDV